MYGLHREMGLAGGRWLASPQNTNWHTQDLGASEAHSTYSRFFYTSMDLFTGRCADIEIADEVWWWCPFLLEEKQSGHQVHRLLLPSTNKMIFCTVKLMPLSLAPQSSLEGAWWFGGWRVSRQCIAPFHPGAVQSSCPIKQAASPGPLPQASSQRLFLHHLFSVTHLQLNCGGCCIPPITTSYTSP